MENHRIPLRIRRSRVKPNSTKRGLEVVMVVCRSPPTHTSSQTSTPFSLVVAFGPCTIVDPSPPLPCVMIEERSRRISPRRKKKKKKKKKTKKKKKQ